MNIVNIKLHVYSVQTCNVQTLQLPPEFLLSSIIISMSLLSMPMLDNFLSYFYSQTFLLYLV